MNRSPDNEGLSLAYRILYRIRYIGLHMFGPAQLGEADDPHAQLRRERAAKVAAARHAREAREAEQRRGSSAP
jgi:hypothetical protein